MPLHPAGGPDAIDVDRSSRDCLAGRISWRSRRPKCRALATLAR